MTQLTIHRSTDRRSDAQSLVRPARHPRPARGTGRRSAPVLRPAGRDELRPTRRASVPARACAVPQPQPQLRSVFVAADAPTWRLTERGVAVVLVTGLMIMAAALTVVGLTAAKVTGDGYQTMVAQTLPR